MLITNRWALHMTMRKSRLIIVAVGIDLPYLARVPRGSEWLAQYTDIGFGGWLFLGALNAIPTRPSDW